MEKGFGVGFQNRVFVFLFGDKNMAFESRQSVEGGILCRNPGETENYILKKDVFGFSLIELIFSFTSWEKSVRSLPFKPTQTRVLRASMRSERSKIPVHPCTGIYCMNFYIVYCSAPMKSIKIDLGLFIITFTLRTLVNDLLPDFEFPPGLWRTIPLWHTEARLCLPGMFDLLLDKHFEI